MMTQTGQKEKVMLPTSTTTDDTDGTEGEGNAPTDDTGDRSLSQILVERITRDVLNQ